MKRALVAIACAACTPHRTSAPHAAAEAGISIALYGTGEPGTAYGVVDDRRWVELTGGELVLERIDPGASLASLVIEPLDPAPLAISRCAREALPLAGPHPGLRVIATVRCTVTGAPGRHLVRILYVSRALGYRTEHALVMTAPDRVQLSTRFAIALPAWGARAEATVFDGLPGGTQLPVELARGTVVLDGSTAILATPVRELAAQLRRIYAGAVATPGLDAADAAWGAESTHAVWVWLEAPRAHLATGTIHAHLELPGEPIRDLELAAPAKGDDGAPLDAEATLRLALWPDPALVGTRLRFSDPTAELDLSGATFAERLLLSIANAGDVAREVWIEERARPSRRRRIERAWPKRPTTTGDLVRTKLQVAPHAIERAGYTITYEP